MYITQPQLASKPTSAPVQPNTSLPEAASGPHVFHIRPCANVTAEKTNSTYHRRLKVLSGVWALPCWGNEPDSRATCTWDMGLPQLRGAVDLIYKHSHVYTSAVESIIRLIHLNVILSRTLLYKCLLEYGFIWITVGVFLWYCCSVCTALLCCEQFFFNAEERLCGRDGAKT